MMRELIEQVFVTALGQSAPGHERGCRRTPDPGRSGTGGDHGWLYRPSHWNSREATSGRWPVHGTVNDLAVSGDAVPHFITLNAFLEEGLEIALLRRVVDALAAAARECGVVVVAGDTKVVGRDDCDGIYLATTGSVSVRTEYN